ncbi:hypothetical protein [Muricoccus radiodurans]|uniref:hypothetical protein n=1 Tax=Muricoccus radiodurans TaxID=2231721 RepID=UPI003CEC34FE
MHVPPPPPAPETAAAPPGRRTGIGAVAQVLAAGLVVGLLLGATPLRNWAESHEAPEPVLSVLRGWEEANPLSGWFEAVRAAVETLRQP